MKDFWNSRYSANNYSYGKEPNVFFKEQIDKLKPGTLLLPAEGEGRNAVYASSKGWKVTAYDFSQEGIKKAESLAREFNTYFDYQLSTHEEFETEEKFDVIALIYTHMPSQTRRKIHKKLGQYLKPNGYIIIEAFTKEQIGNKSGGPQNIDMLYSMEDLKEDFEYLEVIYLEDIEVELDEGEFHHGKANIIRFMGQKIE
jgi:SAM-dependent methyltransferase